MRLFQRLIFANLFHKQYDVKKIEEVVYDISLRGLIKTGEAQSGVCQEVDDATVTKVLTLLSST